MTHLRSILIFIFACATGAILGAETDREYVVSLRPGDTAVRAGFRLESMRPEWSKIIVNLDNQRDLIFPLRVESPPHQLKTKVDGAEAVVNMTAFDAVINIDKLVQRHVRPRLQRYTDAQQQELLARWGTLPEASAHLLIFEARQEADGISLYVDDQYVGFRATSGRLRGLTVHLPPKEGSEFELEHKLEVERSYSPAHDPRYLALPIGAIAKPGPMREAELSLPAGHRQLRDIPMVVGSGEQSVDVGVVKQMKGSWALECDEHLARTALDGMPETAHFAVPQATYSRAWVLCAVDDDPKRDPILTARLTRFARSGRGGAISDTTVVLPRGDEEAGEGITQVGTVRYSGREVPLYLVEFMLKPGDILDLLAMNGDPNSPMTTQPYLDFEFLGKLGGIGAQWDSRHKPDKRSISAVQLFGVTLERSPVGLTLASSQPGNIYHDDELPQMTATLTSLRPGAATLAWRITDSAGRELLAERRAATFAAAGEEKSFTMPLAMPRNGWYGVELIVRDEADREMIRHQAAFALLGPNTRQAGYESPYGTWWFSGAHYGAGDNAIAGPMLFKAGLRKTTFAWTKYGEAEMADWAITQNQISWRSAPRDRENPEAAYDEAERIVREQLERFPHCNSADILHESFAHYVPRELLDEKQVDTPEDEAKGREIVAMATFAATFYRERFPNLKLLVGNTSSSASIIAALLRYGFDPAFIDYIGVESPGQTCIPEKLWEGGTQGIWLAREAARKFGHDLPVTGCYEFTARTERTLGPRRQAAWIARDMLLCHAYGFDHINPAILHDAGNAYYNTLWGAGGLCQRYPLLYPKPSYVAVATLTRLLDRVGQPKRIDTGSTTVYALEFPRADGMTVQVLWTALGDATLELTYPQAVQLTQVGCYGDERSVPATASLEVVAGPEPVYLVGALPLASIAIAERHFTPPPPSFTVAEGMKEIDAWELVEDSTLNNMEKRGLPLRTPGSFDLTQVEDDERGPCLQLALRREGSVADIVSEYTVLRLKSPLPVDDRPATVGVWVRGDSGWGKIVFEIVDAAGTSWRTEGIYHDWPGDLSICHDGWRFVSFPIDGASEELNITPGRRWNPIPPAKSAAIQFPIQLSGIAIILNRRALDLTDMRDVPASIRLQDLGTAQAVHP